jgi:hypothetical protein
MKCPLTKPIINISLLSYFRNYFMFIPNWEVSFSIFKTKQFQHLLMLKLIPSCTCPCSWGVSIQSDFCSNSSNNFSCGFLDNYSHTLFIVPRSCIAEKGHERYQWCMSHSISIERPTTGSSCINQHQHRLFSLTPDYRLLQIKEGRLKMSWVTHSLWKIFALYK